MRFEPDIGALIPQRDIVVFAPHYDDTLFLLGNWALGMRRAGLLGGKRVRVCVLFGRSNYLAGSGDGNFDTSLPRLKLATGRRLLEDLDCLDELFGPRGYTYELSGERECFVREKPFADSEMEFPSGNYGTFDEADRQIMERVRERIRRYAGDRDAALIFPLAIKEHIDHFIVREAALAEAPGAEAAFFFAEDKPYAGIATPEEMAAYKALLDARPLEGTLYEAHPPEMVRLAFTHYTSQVEPVYEKGILARAEQLSQGRASKKPCDILYRYTGR